MAAQFPPPISLLATQFPPPISLPNKKDPGSDLCLICLLPVRGEHDALECGLCAAVYHRACGGIWTPATCCYRCTSEHAVRETGTLGPAAEVVELDGFGEEKEEEDVDVGELRRTQREYNNEWAARQPFQRCGVDGCEYQTKQKCHLTRHQARVHGMGGAEAVEATEVRRRKCRARWKVREDAKKVEEPRRKAARRKASAAAAAAAEEEAAAEATEERIAAFARSIADVLEVEVVRKSSMKTYATKAQRRYVRTYGTYGFASCTCSFDTTSPLVRLCVEHREFGSLLGLAAGSGPRGGTNPMVARLEGGARLSVEEARGQVRAVMSARKVAEEGEAERRANFISWVSEVLKTSLVRVTSKYRSTSCSCSVYASLEKMQICARHRVLAPALGATALGATTTKGLGLMHWTLPDAPLAPSESHQASLLAAADRSGGPRPNGDLPMARTASP